MPNRIAKVVNFEGLNGKLERLAPVHSGDKGGRPAYDLVMMFKILLLQSLYQLSDEQTEVQIMDRMSFRLFLGLDLQDSVPEVVRPRLSSTVRWVDTNNAYSDTIGH